MRPKPEQLRGLDVLVFDIQDIGTRFYTYLATMAMAIEEAKTANVDFIVLDRPNPIRGDAVEGPILADPNLRFVTPTAYFQVPVRHGLTAGEMALWHNRSVQHAHLSVIKMRGWKRSMWFDETGLTWVPPSPNMPNVEAAALYPGIGIFEASNLAVGRGTPIPFRWIGAPWLRASDIVSRLQGTVEGVEFSVQDYTPSKSVFEGRLCHGVKITVTDRDAMRPLDVFRRLALALREFNPNEFEWRWDEVKRLVGVDEFRLLWETGAGDESFASLFDRGPRDFEAERRGVLLY
jgi:beta-N-acetylhexosaminidase